MTSANSLQRDTGPGQILFVIGASLFLLCVAGFLLWEVAHTQIVMAVLFEQRLILLAASLFTDSYASLLDRMAQADPHKVSAATLWQLLGLTGFLTLLPVLILFGVMGFFCVKRAPRGLYRDQFGYDGMKHALAQIHPVGQAWLGYNAQLREPPPPSAPLRPMDPFLQPDEWLARYGGDKPGTEAHAQAAQNALAAQLGTPWTGPQALSLSNSACSWPSHSSARGVATRPGTCSTPCRAPSPGNGNRARSPPRSPFHPGRWKGFAKPCPQATGRSASRSSAITPGRAPL